MTFGVGSAGPESYAIHALEFQHEEISSYACLILENHIGGR